MKPNRQGRRTNDLITLLSQPVVILIAAVSLFLGRVILHARRLKAGARDPDIAKLLTLGEGKETLTAHKTSLNEAKKASSQDLTSSRKTVHNYAGDFKRSKRQKS